MGAVRRGRRGGGHHRRHRRLRRLRAAEPGADRGRARPQPVPAHRLPRGATTCPPARTSCRSARPRSTRSASTRRSTTSVDDIPKGDTVAIPNDDANLARGLLVLQSAGLVELKDGGSIFSGLERHRRPTSPRSRSPRSRPRSPPTSLPDVAAAIINNDFVEDAGLKASDAIAQDDPSRRRRRCPTSTSSPRAPRTRTTRRTRSSSRSTRTPRRCRTACSRHPAAPRSLVEDPGRRPRGLARDRRGRQPGRPRLSAPR